MVSSLKQLEPLLVERAAKFLEVVVFDQAGSARGKLHPVNQLPGGNEKLPLAVFGQTVHGTYYMRPDNVEDKDMLLRADPSTLRLLPWAKDTTASVFADCFTLAGEPVGAAPRFVLQRVLRHYEQAGLTPVVAPEVEFYLLPEDLACFTDSAEQQSLLEAIHPVPVEPYGVASLYDLDDFFMQLTQQCQAQEIALGSVSQELGPGQFEANFHHGPPLKLADDMVRFKRTVKRLAATMRLRAIFLSKLDEELPGSSMHIHQSVYDEAGQNVFSAADGGPTPRLQAYLGGLQCYLKPALVLFAPYANSYRRFLSHWSSPVNLEWAIDNRTVGLRVPESPPEARRIENRLAGSDVNPYLAIAGSLAAGFLGLKEELKASDPVKGSAYEKPFALCRHLYEAVDALRGCKPLRELLGDEFVSLYTAMKLREYRDVQGRIPTWELRELSRQI